MLEGQSSSLLLQGHMLCSQGQLAGQAEQAQAQVKVLQAKAKKLQLAADQALAEKQDAEQQRAAAATAAHSVKQALEARVVRRLSCPAAVQLGHCTMCRLHFWWFPCRAVALPWDPSAPFNHLPNHLLCLAG